MKKEKGGKDKPFTNEGTHILMQRLDTNYFYPYKPNWTLLTNPRNF